MAKEAVCQLRMDAEMKEQVEKLYQSLGSSFAEAVRIFAAQSLMEQGMPFKPTVVRHAAFGALSKWADPKLIEHEKDAFADAMVQKHAAD